MTFHPALGPLFARMSALSDHGTAGLVILDLDSTALSTRARQHRILVDYAARHPSAELRAAVADVAPEEIGFLIETPLLERGVDPHTFHDLRAFWLPRFFSNSYADLDIPNPGAPELARAIVEGGGVVYYLTARPHGMWRATVDVLFRYGFPVLRGRGVLHMKPSPEVDDAAFKRDAMHEVRSLGHPVVATFDNEPKHVHTYLEAFPEALHVLFGDIRSPRAPEPDPSLVQLPSFV
ncbi:MAG: hypothetical protein AAF211_00645 [Myxococcota bacterium]